MSASPRMLTIADAALIIVSILLLGYLYSQTYRSEQARTATITDHQGQHHEIDMQHNQLLNVDGAIGESTLQVTDGRIRFTASPCSNKVCIHTGWIKSAGEAAACLPNRLSVQLAGNADTTGGFDSINF